MTITPITAPYRLFCFRCLTLGIPEETIQQGDPCMEVKHGGKTSFACVACYERVVQELIDSQ